VGGAKQLDIVLARIQEQAKAEVFRITQHALEEMDAEKVTLVEVLAAIAMVRYWSIILNINAVYAACSTVKPTKGVLSILFAQQHSQC